VYQSIFKKKILVFVAMFLAVTSAVAGTAKVGSWVSIEGTRMNESLLLESFMYRAEVLVYETVDGQPMQKRKEEFWVNGEADARLSETFAKLDLLTSDQADLIAYVANDCTSRGGVIESITVKAGKFEACRRTKTQHDFTQTFWFGPVPGGVVKYTSQDFLYQTGFEVTGFGF